MEVTGISITIGNLFAIVGFSLVMIWAGLRDLKGKHERSR